MSKVIERGQVQDLLARGAQLVEVLPAREYEEDHLPGAICMPLSEIDRKAVKALDPKRAAIVYCWDSA